MGNSSNIYKLSQTLSPQFKRRTCHRQKKMKTFAIIALAFAATASATPVSKQGDIYAGCGDTKGCVGKPEGCDATGVSAK